MWPLPYLSESGCSRMFRANDNHIDQLTLVDPQQSGANIKVFSDCLPNSTERVVAITGNQPMNLPLPLIITRIMHTKQQK